MLLIVIGALCVSKAGSNSPSIQGNWGPWVELTKCQSCHGIRYKYNCTSIDSRKLKKRWNRNGICESGTYYERVNKVTNSCFAMDVESSTNGNHQAGNNYIKQFSTEETMKLLKESNLWNVGQSRWTRCSRNTVRRTRSIHNYRGRQARACYCSTDNSTIWREEWRYCCAGKWTPWKVIEKCPECGQGTQKSVRICATPQATLDVEKLSLNGEFLSDWWEEDCNTKDCPNQEMKECSILCGEGIWEDDTPCKIHDSVLEANQCCMRGYRGLQATCGSHWHSNHSKRERQRTTMTVAIVLGAEASLIVITVVVIVLLNLGRVPNALTRVFSTCSCDVPSDGVPSQPASMRLRRKANNKVIYQSTKGKKTVGSDKVQSESKHKMKGSKPDSSPTEKATTAV